MADRRGLGGMFSNVDASGRRDEAANYLQEIANQAADARRENYKRLNLTDGSSVLDVGCGLGEVCADLTSIVGATGSVVGIDSSTDMIDRCRDQWGDLPIKFEVGDA